MAKKNCSIQLNRMILKLNLNTFKHRKSPIFTSYKSLYEHVGNNKKYRKITELGTFYYICIIKE